MAKDLIIVESPNKIKSIQTYVGDNYIVLATGGHVRELAKRNGYDPQTFELKWQIIGEANKQKSKKENINEIKAAAKKAPLIYLATDPDREGEAISWHVYDLLDEKEKNRVQRISFNEITKKAIENAIQQRQGINFNLVYSQFARRVYDRVIGYSLSTLVQRNLKGSSAGRVQSVALMFVVDRELERRAFVKEEWYEVDTTLVGDIFISLYELPYEVPLYKSTDSSASSEIKFLHEKDAQYVVDHLSDQFTVLQVDPPKQTVGDSLLPLTTDKMLQLASNHLGWNAIRTTNVAQSMFEGFEINNQQIALISYPRTDSERLSDDFVNQAQAYIQDTYGSEYIAKQKPTASKKTQNVQDAHEAIRPIDITLTPNDIQPFVSADVYRLYNLIWTRSLAALMNPPTFFKQVIRFENNKYKFFTSYKTIHTKGYWVLDFYAKRAEAFLKLPPEVKVGDIFTKDKIAVVKKETTPPPYYTEATLIAALKNAGVGRPSTYASMATIGTKRGYVTKDGNKLIPTEHGMLIILKLREAFADIISSEFTSNMEDTLDLIAAGQIDWKTPVREFVNSFKTEVKEAYTKIEKVPDEVLEDRFCPQCSTTLVIKRSKRNKEFVACPRFPECKLHDS